MYIYNTYVYIYYMYIYNTDVYIYIQVKFELIYIYT